MLRERRLPPPDIFPPEPWTLGSVRYDPKLAHELAGAAETMFALSNGYLGIRGTPDEGRPAREPGVFLNGFYELRPITTASTPMASPASPEHPELSRRNGREALR
jgi:alpha,alpha-trehalose phosphorylase